MDKDRLKELEIESILEETHYLADQERMEQTAQNLNVQTGSSDSDSALLT